MTEAEIVKDPVDLSVVPPSVVPSTALAPIATAEELQAIFGDGKVQIGRTGLIIQAETEEEFSLERFGQLFKYLNSVTEATPWNLGDAINACETLHGEKAAQIIDAAHLTGYTEATIRRICSTCANVAPEDRDPAVPFFHHTYLTKFKPHEQRRLLKKAHKKDGIITQAEFIEECNALAKGPGTRKSADAPPEGATPPVTTEPETAPAELGGVRFSFYFRARDANEDLPLYFEEMDKGYELAKRRHTDPAFVKQEADDAAAAELRETRSRLLVKITKEADGLPELQRPEYLAVFTANETAGQAEADAVIKSVKARVALNKALTDSGLVETEHAAFVGMLATKEVKDIKQRIKARKDELAKTTATDDAEAKAAAGGKTSPTPAPKGGPTGSVDTAGLAVPKPSAGKGKKGSKK
jgi:hypothetical protein